MILPAVAGASLSSVSAPAEPGGVRTDILASQLSEIPAPSGEAVPEASSGCGRNMARVGGSCVDRYEGSLVEVHVDGSETPFSPYEAPSGHHVRAVARPGVVPQAHISMVEARGACEASGKRLCRAREWKAACQGPAATKYPYGDAHVPHACVDTGRTSPMVVLHHGERSARTMNDPGANQVQGTIEPTGAAAECTNGYGVHDMVGNVHEWTDDGSFRGGYYLDTKLNGEGCDYRTTAHAPTYHDYSTGFRCCADPGSTPDAPAEDGID
jgi:hypothetical protein